MTINLLTELAKLLKSIRRLKPEVHVDNQKPHLHGYHNRGSLEERNRIHINHKIIERVENSHVESSEYYESVFLLLATLAHEYSHWLKTQISPEEDTPTALGYSHARGAAEEGQGESGFAAEIAIFNGFIQCNLSHTGGYRDFRLIDRYNVAHHLPIPRIKEYWKREYFEPFVLDDPVYKPVAVLPTKGEIPEIAKVTTAESLLIRSIPPCQCSPYLVLSEMNASAIRAQRPQFNVSAFTKKLDRLDERSAAIELKMVSAYLRSRRIH